jgi:nicotinamide-nucleotide amidase
MKCEIISIGDELLIGQTVNTNASYLARQLTAIGVVVKWVTTVGDEADVLTSALATAMSRSDVIIATGGLGPTHDDITKKVAAAYYQSDFVFVPEIVDRIRQRFAKRGLDMPKVNEEQARIPEKAEIIPNPVGTAPGLLFREKNKKCFILPGVPSEMKAMCDASIIPILRGHGNIILQRTLRTTGIAESALFEQIGDIEKIEQLTKVAFLPKLTGVDIRLTAGGSDQRDCEDRLKRAVELISEKIGDHVYGVDEKELYEVVAELLIEKGKTLSLAESCTGGLLASRLTNVSGSSAFLDRCVVTYSNRAKMELLGIPREVLETHGAVSSEVAAAMAAGVRKTAGTDLGLSITGIAGPTGGTVEKPVGLAYIALADDSGVDCKHFQFSQDRLTNKDRTVQAALKMLWQALL